MQERKWVVRGRKMEGGGGEKEVTFIKSSGHQTLQKKYYETCQRERASKRVCERESDPRERERTRTL